MPSADEARAAAAKRRVQEKETQAGQIETARWLWGQRRAPQGTPVETYLRARGYTGVIPATIAYLPARGQYPSAMLAAYAVPFELDTNCAHRATTKCAPCTSRACSLTAPIAAGTKTTRAASAATKSRSAHRSAFDRHRAGHGQSLTSHHRRHRRRTRVSRRRIWRLGGRCCGLYRSPCRVHATVETLILERHPDAASYAAVAKLRELLAEWPDPPEVVIREAST